MRNILIFGGHFGPSLHMRQWLGTIGLGLGLLLCFTHSSAQESTQPIPAESKPAPAVVTRPMSTGTGFMVAESYLLTAYHVIKDKDSVYVGPLDGKRWIKAEVVKVDALLDLALLSAKLPFTPLSFALWSDVPTGLEVTVIGYPQPRIQGWSKKITQGLVNGNRGDRNDSIESGFLQFSAEVQMGNSGGPLISPDGLVVGMVMRKLDSLSLAERTHDLSINVNFAVKSSEILNFLKSSPVVASVKPMTLTTFMRPYQIFAHTQSSIVAVTGINKSSKTDAAKP